MNAQEIEFSLKRIALEILEKNTVLKNVALIGIRSRGVPMVERLSGYIFDHENIKIKTGILDITLYRDDLSQVADNPVHNDSEIDFDVNYAKIIFVDDVLYTGRTVLSAIQAIQKMGKPKSIQLCVLIDRGHHELPFEAEYIGKSVPTSQKEIIKVSFLETDEEENVKILERD